MNKKFSLEEGNRTERKTSSSDASVYLPVSQPNDFRPAAFLSDRHLMTIVPSLWPRRFPASLDREKVEHLVDVSETARVKVVVNRPEPDSSSASHRDVGLVLVHGLEGCADSPYMKGVAGKALARGFSVVRLNLRNCGGTEALCDTLYNAGMSEDVTTVASWARRQYGFKKLFLVGFSLGGNLVLKAAAEQEAGGDQVERVDGVCAISPSIELEKAVDRLEIGLNRIYQNTFLFSLRQKIKKKHSLFPQRFSLNILDKVKTVKDFDELYTAPDGGYRSARHYYEESSSLSRLNAIKIPGLIISSLDDPIVPGEIFARREHFPDNMQLITPEHGGHGGFLSTMPRDGAAGVTNGKNDGSHASAPEVSQVREDRFWAEARAVRFCLENI